VPWMTRRGAKSSVAVSLTRTGATTERGSAPGQGTLVPQVGPVRVRQ
jgi:hypothetical protein